MQAQGGVSSSLENFAPGQREFDHPFLSRGRESDKKICPGGWDSLAQKISRELPGGGSSWN